MSRCSITFSANTGGALSLGPFRVWYDALHRRKVPSFSTLSPALLEAVEADPAFSAPDMIYFSHCHPDHFSHHSCSLHNSDCSQCNMSNTDITTCHK